MSKLISVYLVALLLMAGCAHTEHIPPLTQSKSAKELSQDPNVSKITIFAMNKSSMRKMLGLDFAPGAISINGESLGGFSKNEQTFSHELSPGENTISVGILNLKLKTEPNTHYFYSYEFGVTHWGVASTNDYSLKFLEKKPYREVTKSQNEKKVLEKTQSNKIDQFAEAKKTCAELGFKPGTESFGNCVLKVGK